jgi:hypothetical protein
MNEEGKFPIIFLDRVSQLEGTKLINWCLFFNLKLVEHLAQPIFVAATEQA